MAKKPAGKPIREAIAKNLMLSAHDYIRDFSFSMHSSRQIYLEETDQCNLLTVLVKRKSAVLELCGEDSDFLKAVKETLLAQLKVSNKMEDPSQIYDILYSVLQNPLIFTQILPYFSDHKWLQKFIQNNFNECVEKIAFSYPQHLIYLYQLAAKTNSYNCKLCLTNLVTKLGADKKLSFTQYLVQYPSHWHALILVFKDDNSNTDFKNKINMAILKSGTWKNDLLKLAEAGVRLEEFQRFMPNINLKCQS